MAVEDVLSSIGALGQIIPGGGAIGSVISGIGGLLGGAKKKREADRIAAQRQAIANSMLQNADSYAGLADPRLRQVLDRITGQALNYDPATYIDPRYRAGLEQYGAGANNAVNALINDYASRGLSRDSSGLASGIAGIRANAQAQGNQLLASLYPQAMQYGTQQLENAASLSNSLSQRADNLRLGALGTMGGLEGLYASEAQNTAGALGTIAGGLGELAAKKKRPSGAGQSTLNTNNAPSPLALPATGVSYRMPRGSFTVGR